MSKLTKEEAGTLPINIYTQKQIDYVASIKDSDLRASLLHCIRLRDLIEADRDRFEIRNNELRAEIAELKNGLRLIGNETGSPVSNYVLPVAKNELEQSRKKISQLVQQLLTKGGELETVEHPVVIELVENERFNLFALMIRQGEYQSKRISDGAWSGSGVIRKIFKCHIALEDLKNIGDKKK